MVDPEGVGVPVAFVFEEPLGVKVLLADGDIELVAVADSVGVADCEAELVRVNFGVPLAVTDGLGLEVSVCELVWEMDGEDDCVVVGVELCKGDKLADPESVMVAVGELDDEAVPLIELVCVLLVVAVVDGNALDDGDADPEVDCVADPELVGVVVEEGLDDGDGDMFSSSSRKSNASTASACLLDMLSMIVIAAKTEKIKPAPGLSLAVYCTVPIFDPPDEKVADIAMLRLDRKPAPASLPYKSISTIKEAPIQAA